MDSRALGFIVGCQSQSTSIGSRVSDTRIPNEQSKDLSKAIYGVGGSGPNILEHGNTCDAQDIYRLHLSGLTDYASAYRIEAVERGVIIPITPDIRGVRFVPHARRALSIYSCVPGVVSGRLSHLRRQSLGRIFTADGPDSVDGPTSIFVPDDAED